MAATKTEVQRERAYRLLMHPLVEGKRTGAYSQEEFDERHREVLQIIDECHPLPAKRAGN